MAEQPQGSSGLRKGVLGLTDAVAQSVALLALALGVAFASSAAAGETGATVPLAYLIAGIGSLALASVIIRFTRRLATAGGLYTYIARGLSPNAGFIGGWLYAGGFAAGISFVLVIASFFLSTFFQVHTSISLSWGWCFAILATALALLAFLDIRLSSRIQLVLAAAGVTSVMVMAFAILFQGGESGISLKPFSPAEATSTQGLFLAVVLGFTGFIGFEAAAAFGEETTNPLHSIPKAVLTAVLVALVFYVFVTWMMSLGFGTNNADAWAKDPAAVDTLATQYVGHWLSVIIDLAVVASGFVAALGGTNLTSRTLFAMGRDGGLPRAFAYTHPRFRTPWVGIAFSLVLTVVLTATLARHYGPITYFLFVATTASLGILTVYILVALSGIIAFWKETVDHEGVLKRVIYDIVVPLVAIAICAYTIYKSIWPRPPAPISYAPWIAGAWLLIGIVAMVWLAVSSPEKVKRFGQVLAEGEGG